MPEPQNPEPQSPPVAERRPVTTEHHGRSRTDDYDWLRDKESAEVLAHLEAENAWTEARTAHLADLRATIFEEIRSRTQETDLSVPTRLRGHWYYSRSFEGKEYGASCRVPVADPDDWTPPQPDEHCAVDQPALPGEEVLLDLNELARRGTSSSRSARRRSAPTTTCSPGRPTPAATSASPYVSSGSRPATSSRTS